MAASTEAPATGFTEAPATGSTEAPATEDVDEQFSRLLEGLRVTLPGVEVLFAFLLAIPFQNRFDGLSDAERGAYVVAVVAAAIATILLIAPSVHQRMRAHVDGIPRRHLSHVQAAVNLATAGTLAFAVAMVAASWLAVSVVFDNWLALPLAAVIGVLSAWAWFWLPLRGFDGSR